MKEENKPVSEPPQPAAGRFAREPGGQSGMLVTRLSAYTKAAAPFVIVGVAAYAAVGVVEAAARVIGFVVGTTIVYYGVTAYRRYKHHDDPPKSDS